MLYSNEEATYLSSQKHFLTFLTGFPFIFVLFYWDGRLNALLEQELNRCITAYWSFLWWILIAFGAGTTLTLFVWARPKTKYQFLGTFYQFLGTFLPFASYAVMSGSGIFDLISEFFLLDGNISRMPMDWYWLNPQPRGCIPLPFGLTGNPYLYWFSSLFGFDSIMFAPLVSSALLATLVLAVVWEVYLLRVK